VGWLHDVTETKDGGPEIQALTI